MKNIGCIFLFLSARPVHCVAGLVGRVRGSASVNTGCSGAATGSGLEVEEGR